MTPDDFTNSEQLIEVGDGHKLYVHDWGNKDAKKAIIYLHGGPGAGVSDSLKNMYHPGSQRVIFFDQRGSGLSLPSGSVDNNTTDDLVDDISKLADNFGFSDFILHGRSWGSCLAMVYAIKNPQRVKAIVTGGIFLGTHHELDFEERGDRYSTFFPEVWEEFLESTPYYNLETPITYHMEQVIGDDPKEAKISAYIYSQMILGVIKLDDRIRPVDFDKFDYSAIKVEAHYKLNYCFLEDDYIINNAAKLTMPIHIIQGRYDVMCVPAIAYKLYEHLPNSSLSWVTAGHSGSDRAIYDVSKAVLLQLTSGKD